MGAVENPRSGYAPAISPRTRKTGRTARLRNGNKIGRIYIQPLLMDGTSLEELNIGCPGPLHRLA